VGLEKDAELFFNFLLVVAALSCAFSSLGHLLAGLMPNQQVAAIMGGMLISLFNLFAGFYTVRGSPCGDCDDEARCCTERPCLCSFCLCVDAAAKGDSVGLALVLLVRLVLACLAPCLPLCPFPQQSSTVEAREGVDHRWCSVCVRVCHCRSNPVAHALSGMHMCTLPGACCGHD
jgi:hypothetical protein